MTILKKRRSKPDALDHKILDVLHRDGRISKTEMSQSVGLSATRCWERMRRMEKEGIIRGYYADIDLNRLAGLSYFTVQVRLADASSQFIRTARFERVVAGIDEIISCQAVLGSVDYIMVVACMGVERFNAIMEDLASRDGVHFEFVTFPVSKIVKKPSSVRLAALLSQGP